jgi:DNA (cytosine-5)-methyltransferase 1
MGLHRAWPDAEIIGVDIKAQPRYPFTFVQADAITYPLDGFDFIWASPPCQAFIRSGMFDKSEYHDLLTATRERLIASSIPYAIENVPGAPMRADVELCGTMFDLSSDTHELRRHRWFELGFTASALTPPCRHDKPTMGVYGNPRGKAKWGGGTGADWKRAMGIDWMTVPELSQAIPPAYSEFIARQL